MNFCEAWQTIENKSFSEYNCLENELFSDQTMQGQTISQYDLEAVLFKKYLNNMVVSFQCIKLS